MPDFRGNICLARNLENLFHRVIDGIGFAPLMRNVNAAVLMRDFRQFDDLSRLREARRHVLKRRGNAERAVFHCLGNQLLHLF